MTGPLAPFADAYKSELTVRGYTPLTAVNQLRQAGRLSRWLEVGGLPVSALSAERVGEFLAVERAGGRSRSSLSRPGLLCLLDVRRALGALANEEPARPSSAAEIVLAGFEHHLLAERALAAGTARGYVSHARRFVDGLAADGLAGVAAAQVTAAVLQRSAGVSVSTTQNFVAGLRSFLRFCFLEGLVELDLSQAALPMTGRRRSSLPRGITTAEARSLLGSCDRRSGIGRRDYAMILTLARLGLRAAEVAGLRLDDIDWRAGELVVRGKGCRQDRLPLPADVGGALAAYLLRGRPRSERREVFIRARAPFTPIDSGTVRSTVRRACRRAGIAEIGGHRLRHTVACEMVAAGVPLVQIAQVLRHSSLQSTAVYARGPGAAAVAGGALAGRCVSMSTLSAHVEDYLRLRRALGFKLERAGWLLPQLVAHIEAAGAATVTAELAIAWARLPASAGPNHLAQRLAIARGFARYLQTIIPATEVPPTGVFPARRHRPTPYLWSPEDIRRLLEAAARLRPPLRGATHEALFGLLAATGMRVGEAIGLGRLDVELARGVVTIREAKFDHTRLVPLHPSVTEALGRYAATRDRLCPRPRSSTFFLSGVGTALDRSGVDATFRKITTAIGVRTEAVRPRVHDLRHGFAVNTLLGWQRSGVAVDERIAVLSAYLGHVSPADTYWYLSATPQLMALAADRLAARFGAAR